MVSALQRYLKLSKLRMVMTCFCFLFRLWHSVRQLMRKFALVAESGLRMTKSKLKISGRFGKEETADEFALIRTYTETCKKAGVDEYDAIYRLTSGNPYSIQELFGGA